MIQVKKVKFLAQSSFGGKKISYKLLRNLKENEKNVCQCLYNVIEVIDLGACDLCTLASKNK